MISFVNLRKVTAELAEARDTGLAGSLLVCMREECSKGAARRVTVGNASRFGDKFSQQFSQFPCPHGIHIQIHTYTYTRIYIHVDMHIYIYTHTCFHTHVESLCTSSLCFFPRSRTSVEAEAALAEVEAEPEEQDEEEVPEEELWYVSHSGQTQFSSFFFAISAQDPGEEGGEVEEDRWQLFRKASVHSFT